MTTTNSIYHQSGSIYRPANEINTIIHKLLPCKTYTVGFDPLQGYFLEVIDDVTIPDVIYGDEPGRAEKIINTFLDRPANTGVILQGEKGSGKTLLTKLISLQLKKHDIPTILVNSCHANEEFQKFIQSIQQPCLVLFDEFDKVYKDFNSQNMLLTLLDGVFTSKKLFIVAFNEERNFSYYFKNRPGRFYYAFDYATLSSEFIKDYSEKNLKDKNRVAQLVNYCSLYNSMSFDMIKALVEEINRYNNTAENIVDIVKDLNCSPTVELNQYKINKITINDPEIISKGYQELANDGEFINPFKNRIYVTINLRESQKKGSDNSPMTFLDDNDYHFIYFNPTDITKVDKDGITLVNKKGEVHMTKVEQKKDMTVDLIRMSL